MTGMKMLYFGVALSGAALGAAIGLAEQRLDDRSPVVAKVETQEVWRTVPAWVVDGGLISLDGGGLVWGNCAIGEGESWITMTPTTLMVNEWLFTVDAGSLVQVVNSGEWSEECSVECPSGFYCCGNVNGTGAECHCVHNGNRDVKCKSGGWPAEACSIKAGPKTGIDDRMDLDAVKHP